MYIYPDNLKAKATMWLWELKDLAVIGILAGCDRYYRIHAPEPGTVTAYGSIPRTVSSGHGQVKNVADRSVN